MTETFGGYVRHRDRLIQESVFNDLRDTLIACRWMPGTTERPAQDPFNRASGFQVMTTTPAQVLALAEGSPITLIDYFPDAQAKRTGVAISGTMAPNTFAMDSGRPGDAMPLELGSNAEQVVYIFSMAFYAVSDAMAQAVMNDLRDRYLGRIVRPEVVNLIDYLGTEGRPVDSVIVQMDVESFQYTYNTDVSTPPEVHLYFAELQVSDFVDSAGVVRRLDEETAP